MACAAGPAAQRHVRLEAMTDPDPHYDRGYEAYSNQNYAEALPQLMPFAEAGDSDAQCAVASMYQLGLGVEANGAEAVRWYRKAATGGSSLACNNLWCIFSAGCHDVSQNKDEARKWYDEAKRRGFPHLPREFY